MAVLPLSAVASDDNKNFTIDLSDLSQYEFQQVQPGLIRHEDNHKTIEIESGIYAVERKLDALEEELNNLHNKNYKSYEYEHEYNQILNEIESFQLELAYLQQDSSQNKVSGSSTDSSCPMTLTQTYASSPMIWGVGLNVTSSYPFGPGPHPVQHPVDIQAFSMVYPGLNIQQSTDSSFTGGHTTGGGISAFQGSGFTASGALVPFRAISTLRDRSFMGLFGCYTKITVDLNILTSY